MKGSLREEFRVAIERLCSRVDDGGLQSQLAAIGFVAPDDLFSVGAFLRFEEDLPPDVEAYRLLSPVEWTISDRTSFDRLNGFLAATRPPDSETDDEYCRRVQQVFEACASTLEELDLRRRYRPSLYLTFAGVDPNPALEREERRFVQRMNSPQVFQQWCNEFG